MKFRRCLSGLLFGTGCVLIFWGLIATLLPMFRNPHLQRVLSSFSEPSENLFVRAMNSAMNFALTYSWRVLLLGVLIAVPSACLTNHFASRKAQKKPPSSYKQSAARPSEAFFQPKPAAPNPFAISPPRRAETKPPVRNAAVYHPSPILEKNQIDELEPAWPQANASDPHLSSRLEKEQRAMAAQRAPASQSGSQIFIRSAYEPPANAPSVQNVSPRIRSTMGRHKQQRRNSQS